MTTHETCCLAVMHVSLHVRPKAFKNDIKAAGIDSLLVTSHLFYLTNSSKLKYKPFTIIYSEENQQILMFEKLERLFLLTNMFKTLLPAFHSLLLQLHDT